MKRQVLALASVLAMTLPLAACNPLDIAGTIGSGSSNLSSELANGANALSSGAPYRAGWKLAHQEKFDRDLGVTDAAWQKDPLGKDSPWFVDEFSDDDIYFDKLGGEAFKRAVEKANIYRKSVKTGQDGWLTVEVAAQDLDGDGKPDANPTLATKNGDGIIDVPAWNSGVVLTSSNPLPDEYRIEYELKTVDFGGKRERNGELTWNYDGKYNGYKPGDCKTNFPWVRKGDYSQDGAQTPNPCEKPWGDVTKENGYYLLSIMDYAKPAPHNNIFIHSHRKVGMDTYSVDASWAKNYKVCNPATGQVEEYTDSTANGINQIFFDGNSFRDPKFAYNQFVMPTECGLKVGDDPNATIVATAELQPDLMPNETYTFAIERHKDSYVTEMTGNFRHVGHKTLRYERKFEEADGHSIWHYNQKADQYKGEHNQTLEFEGPFGKWSKEMWPAGSEYPDNFVIGVPHLNYYEGSATIDNLRLYTR
ncbi:hypothetical protein [Corynebacterium aquilae]|uniref:hypothetical protein n=1 Tax=Corynebacterium aquilae TaxID=203263 RepID=UPI000951A0A4|nr:hypothetical protein [Corynebacterium aquilae]